jgi:hypothetical protein
MAVGLETTRNALIPLVKAVIFSFSASESINTVRISNTTNASVTVTLWFDPTGSLAGDRQQVLPLYSLGRRESILVGGLFNPVSGGTFTAEASVNNALSALITGVTR